jgi:hypothetical protein
MINSFHISLQAAEQTVREASVAKSELPTNKRHSNKHNNTGGLTAADRLKVSKKALTQRDEHILESYGMSTGKKKTNQQQISTVENNSHDQSSGNIKLKDMDETLALLERRHALIISLFNQSQDTRREKQGWSDNSAATSTTEKKIPVPIRLVSIPPNQRHAIDLQPSNEGNRYGHIDNEVKIQKTVEKDVRYDDEPLRFEGMEVINQVRVPRPSRPTSAPLRRTVYHTLPKKKTTYTLSNKSSKHISSIFKNLENEIDLRYKELDARRGEIKRKRPQSASR